MMTLGSSPCAHHQGVLGSGFMLHPLLNSASDEVKRSMSRHQALYPWGKGPRYLLNSWLSGSTHQCGSFEEHKHFLFLPGIEPRFLSRPAHNLVAIQTALYRLLIIVVVIIIIII